ncbi:hypothetical protein DCAR_0414671 [Daucus carota subsp. sativus]|uniref:Uncharacterized protein n=1 Tax=Daucus carota subsp. sativus TaxID=79200 RepID=A0A164ZYA9_DAUCS|nr:hypothetical protein DCAR_0414671 [Daucus carota subsp. sativus]
MAFVYLSDLRGNEEDWIIECAFAGCESLSVQRMAVPRFKHRLTEGLIYELRNVKVSTNIYPYRPLASSLRLLFQAATEVRPLGEDGACIPRYGFQFVNQTTLRGRADDVTTLSDEHISVLGLEVEDTTG